MIIILTPCGASEWREEGRLLGRVELPPVRGALEQYERWAEILRPYAPARIFHAPDELATTTAIELALRLSVPVKGVDALDEVDAGLWTGLTDAELEARYETTYHELLEAPLNVTPPQGEYLSDAAERLAAAVRKCTRGVAADGAIAIVLRPVALALVRAQLSGQDLERVWEFTQESDDPVVLDVQKPAGRGV